MIIDTRHLTPAELTEVSQDLTKILTTKYKTKKKKTEAGAVYMFWHNLLGGIIREFDTRISEELDAEETKADQIINE